MEILSKSKAGLTVKLMADKISFAYMDKANNIFYDFDQYRLNRIFDSLKGKKGTFIEEYKGISKSELNHIQTQNNKDLNRLVKKTGLAESAGIVTIFKNKGII
jgi:hypothetical protein